MATRRSAGLLLFRPGATDVEVLIGHMGGPFWSRRDDRGWSVPKGEYEAESEDALAAAYREFTEELGLPVPPGAPIALGELRQPSGKIITAWALEADLDLEGFAPGTFTLEWPKGSGQLQEFPEIDRVVWCSTDVARTKLVAGQVPLLDRLLDHLAAPA